MEFSSIKKTDWIISPMNAIIIDVMFNTFSTTEVYTMKAVEKLEQLQNQFGVWTEADPAVMEAFGGPGMAYSAVAGINISQVFTCGFRKSVYLLHIGRIPVRHTESREKS